jgi:hypothetical protein
MNYKFVLLLAAAVLATGCASQTSGETYQQSFDSDSMDHLVQVTVDNQSQAFSVKSEINFSSTADGLSLGNKTYNEVVVESSCETYRSAVFGVEQSNQSRALSPVNSSALKQTVPGFAQDYEAGSVEVSFNTLNGSEVGSCSPTAEALNTEVVG